MTECPICGNILQTPIVKGVGGIDDIQVYECMECSLQFLNTWKDMEKAENFYKSPEGLFKAGIQPRELKGDLKYDPYEKYLEMVKPYLNKNMKVLEIGPGEGFF